MIKSSCLFLVLMTTLVISAPVFPTPPSRDQSTYSNVDVIVTDHFHLSLYVDFNNQSLYGEVTLTLRALQDASQVVLDYQGLEIYGANIKGGENLNYDLMTPNEQIGSAMVIYLTQKVAMGDTVDISVQYSTTPEGQALSWMRAEQTDSKVLPYLFSQCESNHCRAVAPLQDTPSIKSTYSADLILDSRFAPRMSAVSTQNTSFNATHNTFSFELTIPIPSYLVALAVGNLVERPIGPRTFVVTEPTMMDKCANELKNLSLFLDEAEAYLTPYIWGSYALLVLPPSFPFGGMENPLLTFASPTIIVGDGSQVYVATHEICHSWTGNDVTCENWSNMWLNEGFTTFEERYVSGKIYGLNFAKTEAILGNADLLSDITNYGFDNSYSSLYPNVTGVAPDDSYSEICYEKGFQFLVYLQSLVGPALFQEFVQTYILLNSQKSINYEVLRFNWESFIAANVTDATLQAEILAEVDWDLWIMTPGMPPSLPALDFTNPDQEDASKLADDYVNLKGESSPSNYLDYNGFYANQKVVFLLQLVNRYSDMSIQLMEKIDFDLNITKDPNPEVKQRWYPLGIQLGYLEVLDYAHEFVSVQGRSKYLNPVYQSLWDYGYQTIAYSWFLENEDFYHPLAVNSLRVILQDPTMSIEEIMKHQKIIKSLLQSKRISQ